MYPIRTSRRNHLLGDFCFKWEARRRKQGQYTHISQAPASLPSWRHHQFQKRLCLDYFCWHAIPLLGSGGRRRGETKLIYGYKKQIGGGVPIEDNVVPDDKCLILNCYKLQYFNRCLL